MSSRERIIKQVRNVQDKQVTYRVQCGRYKRAINNGFYFEALLIDYAMMEDRLRSLLYHIGVFRNRDDRKLNSSKQIKQFLREIYFGESENSNKKINLDNITGKITLIRNTLIWAVEKEGTPEDRYQAVLKREYEGCLDIGGLLDVLDQITEWCRYRNEIIHGLLNKNTEDLFHTLLEKTEDGMKYARFLDSQVRALKNRGDPIRKTMRI